MERAAGAKITAGVLLAILFGAVMLVSTTRLTEAQTPPSPNPPPTDCTLSADAPTIAYLNQPFTVTSTQTCPMDLIDAYEILSAPQPEGAPHPFTIDSADISPKQSGVPGLPIQECRFHDNPASVLCETDYGNIPAGEPVTMVVQLTPKECGVHKIQLSGGGVVGEINGGILSGSRGVITPFVFKDVYVVCGGGGNGGSGGSTPSYYWDPSWLGSSSWTAGAPYWSGGYLGGRWW